MTFFVTSWITYELRLDSRLSRRFQTDSIIGYNDRNRHRQRRLEYRIASLTIPCQLHGTLNETTPALCPTEPYSPPFFDKNVSYKLKPRQLFNSHDFIHACVVAKTIVSHKTPDMQLHIRSWIIFFLLQQRQRILGKYRGGCERENGN